MLGGLLASRCYATSIFIFKPMKRPEHMTETHKAIRKRMLAWHYRKMHSVSMVDLLESFYQGLRHRVSRQEGRELDLREAISLASEAELERLDNHIIEERLGI